MTPDLRKLAYTIAEAAAASGLPDDFIAEDLQRLIQALPAPPGSHWTEVLGLPMTATADEIRAKHRELAKTAHPDQGGSQEQMARLTDARDRALKQVQG